MERLRWLVLAALLVAAMGCEGATSGSASAGSQSCRSSNYAGVCEGSYRTIRGTFGHDIELEGLPSDTPVRVEVAVSVEAGRLRFSVTDPDGNTVAQEAAPGRPATLSGTAAVDTFGEFEVKFQALDDEATGISYTIAFEVAS